jgi:transcriptional regulator with XRE-family HTH domain
MAFDFLAADCQSLQVAERVKILLAEARQWCSQERGRQTKLAKILGVSPQALSAWWTGYAGKQPTAEQALALEAFLRDKRRRDK